MTVTKAIILAAGYGTRFLPITKAMPKEMLPIVDKPVIQYVVEDAVSAGIEDIVIVTSSQKRSIEDHFDHSWELETILKDAGKEDLLKEITNIAQLANFIYIRQKGAKGTLPAIQSGYHAIGNSPFLVLFGDDFFEASPSRCHQLIEVFEKYRAPILAAFETQDPEHTKRFGYVDGKEIEPGVIAVSQIIEKPGPQNVPSSYAVVSGYVFTPIFMAYADSTPPLENGEYSYTNTIDLMVKDNQPVYAVKIKNGRYYDCGNKLDYLKTNLELALRNPHIKDKLRDYLQTLLVPNHDVS